MSSNTNWTPKEGDIVFVTGSGYSDNIERRVGRVTRVAPDRIGRIGVKIPTHPKYPDEEWNIIPGALHPVPAQPQQEAKPWELIREAIKHIPHFERTTRYVMAKEADRLEEAAKPKPTLVEATKAFFEWYGDSPQNSTIKEVCELHAAYLREIAK